MRTPPPKQRRKEVRTALRLRALSSKPSLVTRRPIQMGKRPRIKEERPKTVIATHLAAVALIFSAANHA